MPLVYILMIDIDRRPSNRVGRKRSLTATHQYTCTKGTQAEYFLQRDAAEK